MSTELSNEQWDEIERLLLTNRKITAIKLYRDATGAGLRDARDIIDEHDRALRAARPDAFPVSETKGCAGAALLSLLAAGALVLAALR